MAMYKAMVVLHTRDGDPANYCTNSFHFENTNADQFVGLGLIDGRLQDFYKTTAAGASNPVKSNLGNRLAANGHEIRYYDLADPLPRVPKMITTMDFTTVGADCLPEEVAVCASFQATKVAGQPQARRRNRVYIGPLTKATADQEGSPNFRPRVLPQFATNLAMAMKALNLSNTTTERWKVYSPTNAAGYDVANGWVDDAFDTQRRRGNRPVSRTTT